MKQKIVDFKTAQFAKELGFNWDVNDAYNIKSKELCLLMKEEMWAGYPVNLEDPLHISAPTQAHLKDWMRENWGIVIIIDQTAYDGSPGPISYQAKISFVRGHELLYGKEKKSLHRPEIRGYSEVLEMALNHCMTLIKEHNLVGNHTIEEIDWDDEKE